MMIPRFFDGRGAPKAAGPGTRRSRRSRPALEALEGRALLSLLGSESRVSLNPQATDNVESDTASSSNGTSVAVWVNAYSSVDHDIWAQRFDSAGNAAGARIPVDFTTANSFAPRVATDSQGRFVVTWQDANPDGTFSVMMRYFDASGLSLTGITQVTSAGSTDYSADVAASDGSIVVTWTHQYSTTDHDIWAERFVISGGVPQAQGIFFVNIDTNEEGAPSVAMSPDGRFDIAYERRYNTFDWDIFASQYDADGLLVRNRIPINFDDQAEYLPSVAMDAAGNAVVAYERSNGNTLGIFANRLSSGGAIGAMNEVNDSYDINDYTPSVALSPTGQYVVAYGSDIGMQVTEVGSNDTLLTTLGTGDGISPSVSIDSLGHYVVTYARFNWSTGHYDIFSRRDVLS